MIHPNESTRAFVLGGDRTVEIRAMIARIKRH